eukprot:m.196078 g.196078  ORF g.196078 m.196078 type:complete len:932 (+) comp15460_c15_seq16:50-2845(+)
MGSTASTAAGSPVRAQNGHGGPGFDGGAHGKAGISAERSPKQTANGARAVLDNAAGSSAQRYEEQLHETVYKAFASLDKKNKGLLDANDFFQALHSRTINLNLSDEEKEEFKRIAGFAPNTQIPYCELITDLRGFLQNIYRRSATDWNDWSAFWATNEVLYLNKRTGAIQQTQPAAFSEGPREEQKFEYFSLVDGTEICTYVDEQGHRMYMDWETQEWRPIPQEWYDAQKAAAEQNRLQENDPRLGTYAHPTRGNFTTYFLENPRNSRLYFDEELGQWARMPLAWERNIPEVKRALEELDHAYPDWKNVNEQLLALRECNYDLADTLVFAEINWRFKAKPTKIARTRPGTAAVQGAPDAKDLGTMSVAAATRIHELEQKLAAASSEADRLRRALEENADEQVQNLTREKTRVESTLMRREKTAHDAQAKLTELSHAVFEQRELLAEYEREIVAYKADRERMHVLEKQLSALQNSEPETASKARMAEAENLRLENVALKLKLQQLKTRLDTPLANPTTVKVLRDLYDRVRELKREKDALANEVQVSLGLMNKTAALAVKRSRQLDTTVREKVEDITKKYRSEVLQRKLLYNKIQELRGNIRVFCRVRNDVRITKDDSVFEYPSQSEVLVQTLQGDRTLMDFDRVFGPAATQEAVFEDTRGIVMSCVDGYNVCIMAYGQTGSGKTFTMMGPPDNMGVNRRAIRELLDLCSKSTDIKYTIKVSMMEVYNEKIFDLLSPTGREASLEVHLGANGRVFVGNLVEESVDSAGAIESILARGSANRSVASTAMNTDSSRSHLLMQISVTGFNTISKVTTVGKLTLVDLAGSERVAKSEASGPRLVEAAAINKSLSALGQVFTALQTSAPHVPYRNSKLTHVLQDSLGGDSKTAVFINCSPLASNLAETQCTLTFGRNIRKIELGPAGKNRSVLPPPKR